ncbi:MULTISPECIES: c-type cytochrome [unclassified Flavobacterium]|uniref:c-type cytochrome n=1 Tax=unclassified Flavobacterium TaxID=196869 RepID=UPI003F92178E
MMIIKLPIGLLLTLCSGFYYADVVIPLNDFSKTDYVSFSADEQDKTPLQKSVENGKEVYTDFCMQCHMANGKGDTKNFPNLAGSNWLTEKRAQSIHAVKFGLSGPIVVNAKKFNSAMPAMGLRNQEVADVMNYIMTSWGNKQKKSVTVEEVAAVKK